MKASGHLLVCVFLFFYGGLPKCQLTYPKYCNMDRNTPEEYLQGLKTSESVDNARHMISYIASLKSSLVRPILTPRFAIACSDELLYCLGDLAETTRLPIQTHISENRAEVEQALCLFPSSESYAHIYHDHGLLGPTTILAHGVHLTEKELTLIKRTGAGISHCPASNFHLSSGVAKVGEWLDKGIKVRGFSTTGSLSALNMAATRLVWEPMSLEDFRRR
jgi:guanine deaminase